MTLFVAADMAIPLFLDIGPGYGQFVISFIVGILSGQAALIATWAVLGTGSGLLRLVWALCLGVCVWYCILIGFSVTDWLNSRNWSPTLRISDALEIGVSIVGSVFFFMVPLWIARGCFRWQLMLTRTDNLTDSRQFTLRHLLSVTIVVAVLLAAGRPLLPPGEWRVNPFSIPGWILQFGILCVLSATVVLPVISITMRLDRRPLIFVLALSPGYCLLLTMAEFIVIGAVMGGRLLDDELIHVLFFLQLALAVTLASSLRLLQFAGFRLVKAVPRREE